MSFKIPCFCISVLRDFTKNALKKRFASLEAFLKRWKSAERKQAIIEELENEGPSLDPLTEEIGKDLDPFDLICHVAFDQPALTRRERAETGVRAFLTVALRPCNSSPAICHPLKSHR